jgi:hypothetical protein
MTLFISHRTDGFGARLLNMLVTMVLAERHGCDFRFTWKTSIREFHALDAADKIFTPDFLAEHLVEAPSRRRQGHVFVEQFEDVGDEALAKRFDRATRAVVVSRFDDPELLLSAFAQSGQNPFADAFPKIRFVEELKTAIDAADQAPLPDRAVAIHLRSGDIVFGDYRLDPRFETKIIPLPLARFVIQESLARGEVPIIFGQDEISCSKLAASMGIRTIEQMFGLSRKSALERVLFEAVILSRMKAIHGGQSAFLYVPSLIGAVPVIDPETALSREAIARTIVEGIGNFERDEEYPRPQIAYAYRSAFFYGYNNLSLSEKISLGEGAVRHDPHNAFYRFANAALLIENGKIAEGDAVLKTAFHMEDARRLTDLGAVQFLTRRRIDGSLNAAQILQRLTHSVDQGQPYARFAFAIASWRLGDYPSALRHLRVSRRAVPQESLFRRFSHILWRDFISPVGVLRYLRYRMDGRNK